MSGSNGSYAIAHGALMCAVWSLLIPFGILVARHRWLVDLEGLRWAAKSRLPFIIIAMVRPYTYKSDSRRLSLCLQVPSPNLAPTLPSAEPCYRRHGCGIHHVRCLQGNSNQLAPTAPQSEQPWVDPVGSAKALLCADEHHALVVECAAPTKHLPRAWT